MGSVATLDWIFLGVLLISMVIGAWRGLIFEVLSVVSWIAAFVLAQWFAPAVGQWLPLNDVSEVVRYGLGFGLVFIATIFAGGMVAFVVKKMVSAVGLRPADRLLGAAFGLVRGGVILLALAIVVGMTPFKTAPWWTNAQGPQVADAALHGLKPVLPEDFGKYLP